MKSARTVLVVLLLGVAAAAIGTPALGDTGLTQASSGVFSNQVVVGDPDVHLCGGPSQPSCAAIGVPSSEAAGAQIRWGAGLPPSLQSGLGYVATPGAVAPGVPFVLGKLEHFNTEVALGSTVESVDLGISATVGDGSGTIIAGTIPVSLNIDETPNVRPCPYPTCGPPCADKVSITSSGLTAFGDRPGVRYTLEVLGFKTNPSASAPASPDFISDEGTTNTAFLMAQVSIDHAPVAAAGPAQATDATSAAGASVELDGGGSTDPDGDGLTYTWTGPFGTAAGKTPTVTLPAGTSTVTLTVSDGTLTSTDTTSVTVFPPISASGTSISGTEGDTFSGVVAAFTDADSAATPGEYAATIAWGDGSTSAGTIAATGSGSFTVSASHLFAEEGTFDVRVTISDTDNAFNSATVSTAAAIDDAALHATGRDLVSQATFDGPVASFADDNASGVVSDFTATIDWGDGSTPSAGTVSGSGPYVVSGSHTYATLGHFTITIHVVDDGGSTADARTGLIVFATSDGGAFVIGNRRAAVGDDVTFWGNNWWKTNGLSGHPAPASFKGFETSSSLPACGSRWTTSTGNSPPPPSGPLPGYMAVVVTDSVTQSGSTIAGTVEHVVVVHTNGGYSSDPGHRGTGTIVATIC